MLLPRRSVDRATQRPDAKAQMDTVTTKRVSLAAVLALAAAIVALALAATAVVRYRGGEVHFASALNTFEWGVYTAGAGLLLSLIGLWRARPGGRRRGFTPAVLGLVIALPLVAYGMAFEYTARIYPPINDVSTDTEDPPSFWEVPNPVAYPGAQVAALQQQGYPDLKPLELDMTSAAAFALAVAVARDSGWEIVSEKPDDLQLEAVATTWLFGFKDNVAVRVQDVDGGARLDVRSHSRLGRIDRGANAKRIRSYLRTLEQRAAESSDG